MLGMPRERLLETSVWIDRTPDVVFPFFADAANLNELTPAWLNFRIVTPAPIVMREGAIIDYRIVLKVLPMRWRTRIAAWEPPHRFVDEQIRGPYALWHHEHRFLAERGGTRCVDRVRYAHWGGAIGERLLVRPDLERIFAYRREAMLRLFGPAAPAENNRTQA
jgi:ligand-binding SRPBCC domain-containing protein